MIKINKKFALNISDSRNIDVMVRVKTKTKDGTVKEEWKVFGHVGRNIKSAIRLLLDANVMHSEAKGLWDLAIEQEQLIDSIDIKAIADYDLTYTIETQEKRIKELEEKIKELSK